MAGEISGGSGTPAGGLGGMNRGGKETDQLGGGRNRAVGNEGRGQNKNTLRPQIPDEPPGIDVPEPGPIVTPAEPEVIGDTAPAERRPRRRAGLGLPGTDSQGITGRSGVFIP